MSFLRHLYFFHGKKYTSFGKNILLRQSTSLAHSATGHPAREIEELLWHFIWIPYWRGAFLLTDRMEKDHKSHCVHF